MDWLWTSRQNSPLAGTRLQHSTPEIFKRSVCVTCVRACARATEYSTLLHILYYPASWRCSFLGNFLLEYTHHKCQRSMGHFQFPFSEGQLKIKFLLTPLVRTTLDQRCFVALQRLFCGRDLYKMLIQDSRVVPGSIASSSSIIFGGTKSPTSVRLRWVIKKKGKSWHLSTSCSGKSCWRPCLAAVFFFNH